MKWVVVKSSIMVAIGTFSAFASIFHGGAGDPSASGSAMYAQIPGSTTLRGKEFSNNFYRASGASGTVLHNVNLMTGQPVYAIPLAGIAAGDISFPVSIGYSGPVRQLYEADNSIGATGWIGYGWSLSTPFVAVNHKGTTGNYDDIYYCNLGPYGGGQLLQKGPDQYVVASDPSITVGLQRNSYSNVVKWTFLTASGIRLIFGTTATDDKSTRNINWIFGLILGSPYSQVAGPAEPFVYRWDLSRIEEYGSAVTPSPNALEFKYDRFDIPVGGGKAYTRESYLKEVIRKDALGNRIERLVFETSPKEVSEYSTRSFVPTVSQELYETRFLSKVSHFIEDKAVPEKSVILESHLQAADANLLYPKRFLDKIRYEFPNPRGGILSDDKMSWKFTYDANPVRHFALKTVVKPFVGKDEFEYDRPWYGPGGSNTVWTQSTKQDGEIRRLTTKEGVEIELPATSEEIRTQWENQSVCTEKLCFMAVVKKGVPEVMHVEVWKNNGNFFELAKRTDGSFMRETFTSNEATDASLRRLKILPWGDNFIVVDSKDGDFWLFEWNGEAFATHSKSILGSNRYINTGAGESIQIHLGNDFFLVEDRGTYNDCTSMGAVAGTKIYIVKKVNGIWTELNQGTCGEPVASATCAVDFAENYGESGYTAEGCMGHKANNLFISAGKSQFHIVDPNTGIIFSYFAAQFGEGFSEKSLSYIPFDGSVQKAGSPMNWEWTITAPIQIGEDYFLVQSQSGYSVRIDIMHYDGWVIDRLGGPAHTYATGSVVETLLATEAIASFRAWVSDDYFITTGAQTGNSAEFWYKRIQKDQNGVPTGIGFNAWGLKNDIPLESQCDVRVATSTLAFSIELYPNNGAPGGQPNRAPLLENGDTDYRSYLYQVNPYPVEMEDIYSLVNPAEYKDGSNRKLYDFEFSASENLLSAKSCLSATNGICNGGNNDVATYHTGQMTPWRTLYGGAFIRQLKPIYNPWVAGTYSYNHDQFIRSSSARLGALCMLNTTSRRMQFSLLQSTGTGFTQFPYQITINNEPWADLNLVTKVKSYGGITGQGDGRWTEHVFKYTPTGSAFLVKNPEYNVHHQSFIFPNVSVYTYRGSESMPSPLVVGAETVNNIIDESSTPLPETHLGKLGMVTERRLDDMKMVQGQTLFERSMSKSVFEYYPPQREPTWPDMLYLTRLKKTTATVYDRNSSTQSRTTSYHKYHPFSNSPLFVKSNIGGKWNLTQTLYNGSGTNQGLSIGHNSFKFSVEPPDAVLNGWLHPDWDFNQDNAVEKATSASRVEFDAVYPFQVKKTKVWKDSDPTLNSDELKRGVDPIHSLAEGWQDQQVVEKRNALGQGLESRALLTNSGGDRRRVLIYEGRSSLPVGEFDNAYYEDVAVLTGENFNVMGLLTHDWQGRWVKADAGATESTAHSGRASIKVVNNTGPRTDLVLKGPESQGYDYLVSAWIYCEPGTTPALKVERFRAGSSTSLDGIMVTSPDGENLVSDKWQRYQVKLSAAFLRSNNFFVGTGSGDFLRVSVGTSGNGTVYVDDIVCRPSTSTYALRSYNGKQQVTHSMDMTQDMVTFDYDLFGNPSGVRDEKHRIFTSTASHQPGEND